MDSKYVVRKIDPSTPRRVDPQRRPPKRRKKPAPPWGLIALAAVVVILVVVLVVVFSRKKGGEEDTSSLVSQALSTAQHVAPLPDAAPDPTAEPEPTLPMPDQAYPDGEPQEFDSLITVGGSGYGLYKFSEEDTNQYIELVCRAADQLPETASLYAMIVPTSLDVLLDEEYITENSIDSSDQRKAIEEYIYPSMQNLNGKVKTVSLFDPLRSHCDEYIYYKTDASWTQLGAYYAYGAFCKAAGLEAVPLEDFEEKTYSGYLGGYYNLSNDVNMTYNTDTVTAYVSDSNTALSFTTEDGSEQTNWPVIQDGDAYDSGYLSLIFMAGDQPYAEIVNQDLDDDSACVVVKESLGNVFVPFLAEHYQHVYVVDYRSYSGSVIDLVEEMGATDVILLNGIRATSDPDSIDSLSSVF